jgi:PucR family transcriptional regulator, purine catabolism regulatory protein
MPITLRDLVQDSGLRLRVRAGDPALDRQVHWVHSTELIDPTPFLEGGELLLTTGMGLRRKDYRAFVHRVADQGVAGLGLGTGLSHDTVPRELIDTATGLGLPLLEVPRETPFIAISKTVSRALAADEYAAVARTSAAQQELTRAAVRGGGFAPLLRRLSRLVGAWALLVNTSGEVAQSAPASAASRGEALRDELDRIRGRRGPSSARFTHGGDNVWAQALGSPTNGFLVVGSPHGWSSVDQQVVNTAASLLTLALEQSKSLDLARRDLRAGLFKLLAAGQVELVRHPARELGVCLAEPPWQVCALVGAQHCRESATEILQAEAVQPVFFADAHRAVVAVVGADSQAVRLLGNLPQRVHGLRLGISQQITAGEVANGHQQAMQAAEHAERTGTTVMRFDDIAGMGLLAVLPSGQAQAFAKSLLAPLLRDNGKLIDSLREWLQHHGQWDPAAARLGVHRHTLRNRMRKIEELTDRSLDSPGFRAELWFSLQLLDNE